MNARRVLAAVAAGLAWGLTGGAVADVVVVQNVEQNGKPPLSMQMTLKLKGAKIRADMGPETSIIMDTATGASLTLRHQDKTALEISGEAARQLMQKAEELQGASIGKARLEPGGKGEPIAGRDTRRYTAQAGALHVTWWVAAKIDGPDPLALLFEALQKAPMVRLAGGISGLPGGNEFPGVPMKTEMTTPDGRVVTTTVVSVKEERLDAVDFAVPAGYRRLAGPLFGPGSPSTPAR